MPNIGKVTRKIKVVPFIKFVIHIEVCFYKTIARKTKEIISKHIAVVVNLVECIASKPKIKSRNIVIANPKATLSSDQ